MSDEKIDTSGITVTEGTSGFAIEMIIGLILLGLIFLFYRGCIYASPEEKVAKEAKLNAQICEYKTAAYSETVDAVKLQLKSPATAEFPSVYSEDYTVQFRQGGASVAGFVDAQNGFGAMIRNTFVVRLSCNSETGTWKVEDLAMK